MQDDGDRDIVKDWLSPEQRLRVATRAAGIGIWEWDLTTDRVEYSLTAREIVGFGPDEPLTAARVRALVHPEDAAANKVIAQRLFDPVLRAAPTFRYRLYRHDDGAERWILTYIEAVFSGRGADAVPVRCVGTIQDITEQVHTETRLKHSEERLRMAVEAGNLAVWEVDLERGEVAHSPALNRMCGFPEDARPTLEEFRSRYAPGERERAQMIAAEALGRGENRLTLEVRHLWPDGTEKWLSIQSLILKMGNEGALHAIGIAADITERKRQQLQLETAASEMRHRVKNQFAVISAIASQSLGASSDPAANRKLFLSRLQAMATATDLILEHPDDDLDLSVVIETALGPFRDRPEAFAFGGDGAARIPAGSVRNLALALHELATNAVKYGALSRPQGRVSLDWGPEDGMLRLTWHEAGGPPVTPPDRKGFGTTLLTRGLFAAPEKLRLDYRPDGLVCEIRLVAA